MESIANELNWNLALAASWDQLNDWLKIYSNYSTPIVLSIYQNYFPEDYLLFKENVSYNLQ